MEETARRQPVDRRQDGLGPGIDKDVFRFQHLPAFRALHRNLVRGDERADAGIDRDPRTVGQVVVIPVAQRRNDLFLDRDGPAVKLFFPVERKFEAHGRRFRLVYQRFGRNASGIDTSSAVHLLGTFDYGHRPFAFGQFDG